MEFPGVLKKKRGNSRGQKRSGNSSGIQEKLMWNFRGSWFFTLEFPRVVAQICRISRGKSFFSPEVLGLK